VTVPTSSPFAALREASVHEAVPRRLALEVLEVGPGTSAVAMTVDDTCLNLFGTAHGGMIFALLDEAFEMACNSHGTMAVALNVNVSFTAPAFPGDRLTARAVEMSRTARTAVYDIRVTNQKGDLVAACQALAYRKRDPLPFLSGEEPRKQ
jgi:acyl-CoA thioesterase